MTHLFSRLYKYKESESRDSKENFLTEIMSTCLDVDDSFRKRFLKFLKFTGDSREFHPTTQFRHKLGIPDIYIEVGDSACIIIECKISARQGATQLKQYAKILKSTGRSNLYLVYLTRATEVNADDINFEGISFVTLLWHQVDKLLDTSSENISIELHNYLTEEGMSNKMNFKLSQVNAIREYDEFIETAKQLLNRIKLSIKDKDYGIKTFTNDKSDEKSAFGINFRFLGIRLWVGFYQYEHNKETQFGISSEGNRVNSTGYKNLSVQFDRLGWDEYPSKDGNYATFHLNRDLSTFFDSGEFSTEEAVRFIDNELGGIRSFMKSGATRKGRERA